MPSTTSNLRCRTWRRSIAFLSALMLSVALGGRAASGQGAERKPPDKPAAPAAAPPAESEPCVELDPDEDQKKNITRVGRILQEGKFAEGDQVLFDAFFKRYFFPLWTRRDNQSELLRFRTDLRNYVRKAWLGDKPHNVHAHLNALALDTLNKMATGNLRLCPPVRVNAMLTIGELNSVETPSPVPLPAALPLLLATVNDPKQPEAVKVAALVGVLRHAAAGISAAPDLAATEAAMLALVTTKTSANPGRGWLLAQAAEVLGDLGTVGQKGQVVAALQAMMANATLPLSARCAAADAIAKLNYGNGAGLDVSGLVAALDSLAIDACEADTQRLSRRRLKARLHAASTALSAVTPLAKAPADKAAASQLGKFIAAVVGTLDDRNLTDVEVIRRIKEDLIKLRSLLPKDRPKGTNN